MIDFNNKSIIKLKQESSENAYKVVGNQLIDNEEIIAGFASIRDRVVFTNKRIISVNVQGLTGTKVDYTSIPYNKIQLYSVETAGTMDLDSELDIWVAGVGKIRFELSGSTDVVKISKVISSFIL